jgi:4-aminobutyrate aminotransferase-like enzyme
MESTAERRRRLLSGGANLDYEFPFRPVRSSGMYMYDAEGKSYLDFCNNIPHVGHCNPHVIDAVSRQMSLLNVSPRYLFDSILDYAERLTATMPSGLDLCLFTCTGSEANDLAYRLARAFNGGHGVLTTLHGYHGNTTFLRSIDASAPGDYSDAPDWCVRIPAPMSSEPHDPASFEVASTAFAGNIDVAVATLAARGHAPAAFYFDSYFCSDGVLTPQATVMSEGLARFRRAGGLTIVDEVEPGFARNGDHYWGFGRLGIVPDMVVLGKPTGNGYPIGAVVTRREIADKFFGNDRYFNTFAGSPVSCAAGMAVMDVIEKQQLQANAKKMGAKLLSALEETAKKYEIVGRIRGEGLLVGVELVLDRATGTHAATETRKIRNELCREGALVGITGPDRKARNILKIRPPIIVSEADIAQFSEIFNRVLSRI